MLFVKPIQHRRQTECQSRETLVGSVHSPTQMNVVLQRERARADRTYSGFSLIVVTTTTQSKTDIKLRRLARIARQRLRCTDEVGWIDRDALGLLLLDCTSKQSHQIARELFEQLPGESDDLLWRIENYPSGESKEFPQTDRRTTVSREQSTAGTQTVFMRRLPLWKRGLDIVGASLGLLLLLPLFAVVAAIIRKSSPGPVIFKQYRSGWGGRPFLLYKFRSMSIDAESRQAELRHANEQDGPAFKLTNDPRVTPFGQFLRKSSIDELPQLWNVLKGEMTLVGPRPLPCAEQDGASQWQQQRLDVMPGLTCIWQIRGRSKVTFARWVRMDIEYIRKVSLLNDLKILLATIPAVLFRRGAK